MEPLKRDPVAYDREHVVVLSDWTFQNPHRLLSALKKQGGFFNFQQRTLQGVTAVRRFFLTAG